MQFDPRTATLEDLTRWTGQAEPGSVVHTRGMAELTLRQMKTQLVATEAQTAAARAEESAAQASVRAAEATEKNVKYMFWSVVFAATSALISLISTIWTNWPRK